jgi:hypothetical protein
MSRAETSAPRRLTAARSRIGAVAFRAVALAAIGAALALDIATLTRAPEPYGDEAWDGSIIWSFAHGHGLTMSMARGTGIYDGTFDYWVPRIWVGPELVAELVAGTSFTAYRAVSLVIALAALLMLWLGLRRHHDWWIAVLACSAVATTWAFFAAGHYVRWDCLTLLWATSIFTLLVWGPPTGRRALTIGLLIGVAPDFNVPTVALLPVAIALILWEPAGRRRRAAFVASGLVAGVAIYAGMHFLPSPHEARRQYGLVYATQYRLPLMSAFRDHSLSPILDERDRYRMLGYPPWRETRWFLLLGVAASIPALATAFRRRRYPWRAVGAGLLLSQLAGLAVLYANRSPIYTVGAMAFAAAAVVDALTLIRRPWHRSLAVLAVLGVCTIAGGRAIVDGIRASPAGAATNSNVSRLARALVPKNGIAIGDYVYWWLFRDERFRFNAMIWFDRYERGSSFAAAFHKACPDLVIYDDLWKSRYSDFGPDSLGRRYPALAPTDPHEEQKLEYLLSSEYRLVRRLKAGGRTLEFWRRKHATCAARRL